MKFLIKLFSFPGEMRFGTDESTFNSILCQRNYPQLKQIFLEYQNITGHEFERAIKNEFSGDLKDGLLAIVKSVRNKAAFFAERLHDSMAGMGTRDRQLIRIIVTRSEIDMGEIKQAFEARYGKTLESFITVSYTNRYKQPISYRTRAFLGTWRPAYMRKLLPRPEIFDPRIDFSAHTFHLLIFFIFCFRMIHLVTTRDALLH